MFYEDFNAHNRNIEDTEYENRIFLPVYQSLLSHNLLSDLYVHHRNHESIVI